MKYMLPLLLFLLSPLALAEAGAYRVEVIIFRHLSGHLRGQIQMPKAFESDPGSDPGSESDPGSAGNDPVRAAEELRSFSQFPALVKDLPIEIHLRGQIQMPKAFESDPGSESETDPDGLPDDSEDDSNTAFPSWPVNDLPDDLLILNKLSGRMDRVWRRLRSSADYRPLIYAAWEQNRTDYYPPIRIHDEQVIDAQLRPPTQIMIADLTARAPLAAYRSVFYRLDGSVQLRRSRFLHLFVDLVYREETETPATQPGIDDAVSINDAVGIEDAVSIDDAFSFSDAVSIEDLTRNEPQYAIFSLHQNRQISTGKLQYFDTPFLGALIFVTAIAQGSDSTQGSDSNAP